MLKVKLSNLLKPIKNVPYEQELQLTLNQLSIQALRLPQNSRHPSLESCLTNKNQKQRNKQKERLVLVYNVSQFRF